MNANRKKCAQRWMIARAMLMILAFATETDAVDQKTNSVGGTGGVAIDAPCGAGQALVGVHGQVGDWWDRVGGDCVLKKADGSNAGPLSTAPLIGGGGGWLSILPTVCPPGQVVSGISVSHTGSFVDGLCIWCKNLGTNGLTTGTATRIEVHNMYVNHFYPKGDCVRSGTELHCPDNLPGRGLFGKEGIYVDRLGLVCGPIDLVVPKISSLTLDRETVVGGRTVTGTVTLDTESLSSGTRVDVGPAAANTGVSVTPNPVIFTDLRTTFPFQVNTTPRATALTVTVLGSTGGYSRSDTLRIDPPAAISISMASNVPGGTPINGTVRLNGTAPENFVVTVTHSSPAVITTTSPISATCSGYDCSFTANTRAVRSDQTVTFQSGDVNRAIRLNAARVKNVELSDTTVVPGTPVTAKAILTGPVPQGAPTTGFTTVGFTSSNTAAATVRALGTAFGSIAESPVTVGTPTAPACTEIMASLNNGSASAFLGVAPSQSEDIQLTFPNTTIQTGGVVTGTLTANFKGPINITQSNNGVTLSRTVVPVFANRPETFTVTGNSAGCTMVTASSGTRQRSVMIVVFINPEG